MVSPHPTSSNRPTSHSTKPRQHPLVSLTKPPILFSINHETRTLALSTYNFLPIPHMRIPVSRTEDTVYITLSQVRSNCESQDDNHIAIVLSLASYFPITSLGFTTYGRDFKGELGLLDIPEWRQDWGRMANQIEADIRDQRKKLSIVGNEIGDVKMSTETQRSLELFYRALKDKR
ncbi:hypothetical protein BPAE_0013g00480 [Botrytis paeoniae]|uniref:Uncharacterized protein n=1 Tax=Botrytis paeoniae TaxID=278948 RepID=A0A4Z1FXZ8_9HELO|nr:hypothetical protein BPAE_0013g00480 [Botrytis paeoniae]